MKARLVVESGDWAPMKGQGELRQHRRAVRARHGQRAAAAIAGRADAALEQLATAAKTVPDRDAREVAAIMAAELDGLMRARRATIAPGALAALARAARSSRRSGRGRSRGPYPIKPAAELYARDAARHRRRGRAVAQFKAALARTPRRAASLLGLARAASDAGPEAPTPSSAAKDFLAAWHLADKDRRSSPRCARWSR